MKMADVGFVFTTVFLVSYGFVKTVLLDFSPSTAIFAKAKFGKRKFFLRHPVPFFLPSYKNISYNLDLK